MSNTPKLKKGISSIMAFATVSSLAYLSYIIIYAFIEGHLPGMRDPSSFRVFLDSALAVGIPIVGLIYSIYLAATWRSNKYAKLEVGIIISVVLIFSIWFLMLAFYIQ